MEFYKVTTIHMTNNLENQKKIWNIGVSNLNQVPLIKLMLLFFLPKQILMKILKFHKMGLNLWGFLLCNLRLLEILNFSRTIYHHRFSNYSFWKNCPMYRLIYLQPISRNLQVQQLKLNAHFWLLGWGHLQVWTHNR
jgi:hypothetical protein